MRDEIGPKTLLVEGPDDSNFVHHFRTRLGIIADVRVVPGYGYERLRDELDTVVRDSRLQVLGVVVDANLSLDDRWRSIRDAALRTGYPTLPVEPTASGTVVAEPDTPRLGIWLMPDNRLPGSLEHFVQLLVPRDDALWPRAIAAVNGISEPERRFGPTDTQKANIRTWLAWQEEPGTPLGLAITRRYLDPDSPAAAQFRDWLQRLFG